jgi:hypothetical protein
MRCKVNSHLVKYLDKTGHIADQLTDLLVADQYLSREECDAIGDALDTMLKARAQVARALRRVEAAAKQAAA